MQAALPTGPTLRQKARRSRDGTRQRAHSSIAPGEDADPRSTRGRATLKAVCMAVAYYEGHWAPPQGGCASPSSKPSGTARWCQSEPCDVTSKRSPVTPFFRPTICRAVNAASPLRRIRAFVLLLLGDLCGRSGRPSPAEADRRVTCCARRLLLESRSTRSYEAVTSSGV